MTPEERQTAIDKYERGPADLEAALSEAPDEARTWRPAPGDWTIHEIVVHCADSETSGYSRIRMMAAEPEPIIAGYDQDAWTTYFDYHTIPLDRSLAVIRAVRAHTAPLLRTLPNEAWAKQGTHTESGPYFTTDWLGIYSVHLSDHAAQIRRNLQAWRDHGPE
jgi:hypothetical protein